MCRRTARVRGTRESGRGPGRGAARARRPFWQLADQCGGVADARSLPASATSSDALAGKWADAVKPAGCSAHASGTDAAGGAAAQRRRPGTPQPDARARAAPQHGGFLGPGSARCRAAKSGNLGNHSAGQRAGVAAAGDPR